MDTIKNEERYNLFLTTQMLFFPKMPDQMFNELIQYMPKAEEDKDNLKLSNFLAGVALIGEYYAKTNPNERCEVGLEAFNTLKKYGVKGVNIDGFFKMILDVCKK